MVDYDVEKIRADFPTMSRMVHGKPLVFLDSAASAQKPRQMIDAVSHFYTNEYANVHRGLYLLSELATERYEGARQSVKKFLNAASTNEIIFTRNATEAINLVAFTWARKNLKAGDEILVSQAEHHANLVPWQILRDEKNLVLKVLPVGDNGEYLPHALDSYLTEKTKLVAITHMSNVLGTVFPAKDITQKAHDIGAKVLIDGCQSAVHMPIDVRDIDADFFCFSGHKTYGPSGVGVLYGKADILADMPPYQYGGDMVAGVTYEHSKWADPPARFEAGTPAIAQAVGLGASLEYMMDIGRDKIAAYEADLTRYATQKLQAVPGLKIIGTAPGKGGVMSFVMDGAHPQDIATILDHMGVAVRTGHHCAMPLVRRMGETATVRASFGMYNTHHEVDALIKALEKAKTFF